jgi:hypothetical protein
MKTIVLIAITIIALPTFIASCSKSNSGIGNPNTVNCDNVAKSFSVDVDPLIQTFCNQANCHAANSTNGPGPLTNFIEIFNARMQIRQQVQAGTMPQNTTLTTAQKNTIICWIDNGASNN